MRATAIYHALLRCYPAAFRDEYGDEMQLVFAEQLDEARRAGNLRHQAAVWTQATSDALTIAPKEHWHVIHQDLRYACRTTAASPGFAAVAILSLALGIGANTAIFSLWNGVLHASLPAVHRPDELVMLTNPDESGMWTGRWTGQTDGPRAWLTYEEFEQLRDHAPAFRTMMASQSSLNTWVVRYDGAPWEEARGRLVSGGFFDVLGAKPAIGRVFSKDADRIDTPDVVISYPYWQRRFGGRPDVLGTTVTVRNAVLTIIGVAAKGFVGETSGQQPDLWIPLGQQPSVLTGNSWLRDTPPNKVMWLHVFGRLTPGVTLPEAEAQANGLLQAGLESFYGTLATGERRREFLDQRLEIRHAARGASSRRGEFSGSLSALLAGVGLLLAIACANLANLLLARGAARKTEMTVRLSLGASRGRLIRQLVTESLALAALGGVAAIGVAYGLHQLLVRMLAESDPNFRMSFALDPLVLGFLIAATVTAGLLFGVLPAWQATRTDAVAALREQGRGTIGSRAQMRPGRALVSVQLALSLPLLVGAALLVQTAYNLQRVDLGFPSSRVLLARVDLREVATDNVRRDALRREILGHLQRIPGVRAASFSQHGLFTGSYSSLSIAVEGYTRKGDIDPDVELDMVGPGYFSTLGVPLSLGRDILESDRSETLKVCVINEAFAQEFFEGRNPIALHVSTIGDDGTRTTYEVVGVAKNARTNNLRGDVRPRFFVVASQRPMSGAFPTFLIRSNVEPSSITTAVRQAIQRADPALPIASVRTAGIQMAPLTAQDRTTAQLAVVFGCVALALAAIGLYGVLSYGVARRTGEIAIRIALGARPGRVLSMILLETFWFVGAGVLLGGVLAYAASSLIGSRLYGVAPQDPLTFAMASALLLTVAFSAAYAPARRASRLEPIAALRRD